MISTRPHSTHPPERRQKHLPFARRRLITLLALLVGVLLRLLQYAVDRSLWLDEALLSESTLTRGWVDLLLVPLEYGQTAPPGFLLLQKLATTLLGGGEPALRLVPLLAGLAALLWFPAVARRYISRGAVPLATALFALAPFLVYYSSEAKQYSTDALAALAVLWAAAELRRAPTRRAFVAAAATGAAAAWISQPAIFVMAGVGLVLGFEGLRQGNRHRTAALAAVGAAWIAAFAGAYLLSRRSLGDPEYMRAFWSAGFPDGVVWWPRMVARLFREPLGVVGEDPTPLSDVHQLAAALAFALGAAWMVRRGRGVRLALLLAPAGLALAAATLRLYPFAATYTTSGRLLLFLLPALALVVAQGVAAASAWIGGTRGRAAGMVLAMALLASPLFYAAVQVPHLRAEVKPVLEYAAENRQPGDLLYVHYAGRAPFRYYADRFGWTAGNSVVGRCSRPDPRGYLDELQGVADRRLWVLFVDDRATSNHDDRGLILAYLEHRGQRVDDQVSVGAAVYLYDLRLPAASAGPFAPRIPTFAATPTVACRGPWANDG